MGPIEIRNSSISIKNYTLGDNPTLEKYYTYYEKLYNKYVPVYMGMKYDPKNKTLFIPGGTDLYYTMPNLDRNNFIYISPDEYDKFSGTTRLKCMPRDDRQKEAIRFCLGIDEYRYNRNKPQISLNLDTGVGKTYVAIYIFSFYETKTIMITSVYSWLNQWKDKILEYTDIDESEIYLLTGGASIYKLLNGIKDHNKIKFYLATHDTINNYAKQCGWEAVGKLFKFLKIGIKIYDEAHLNFDNICKIDFSTNTWKTFYLTATPMKSKKDENRIYQNAFRTIPKISLFDEDIDPHTSYLAILFNSHPTPYEIESCNNINYGLSPIKYIDYFINTNMFYKMLKFILDKSLNEIHPELGEKILIYIGKNEGIIRAYDWIKYNYFQYSIGIFTTLTNKEEKYNELNNTIILTTAKSSSAALDIKGLKKSIILAEPFNSDVYAKQILGRTRDKDTEMIEFVDVGFKRIKDWYYKKKRNIYSKYAIECNELQINDLELNQIIMYIKQREREEYNEKIKNPNFKVIAKIVEK